MAAKSEVNTTLPVRMAIERLMRSSSFMLSLTSGRLSQALTLLEKSCFFNEKQRGRRTKTAHRQEDYAALPQEFSTRLNPMCSNRLLALLGCRHRSEPKHTFKFLPRRSHQLPFSSHQHALAQVV